MMNNFFNNNYINRNNGFPINNMNNSMMNQLMMMNNNYNLFNNMGMNGNMNMNMFNLMMYYLMMQNCGGQYNNGYNNNYNQTSINNNNSNRLSTVIPSQEERTMSNPRVFGGILPRDKGTYNFNAFPEKGGNKINIFFQAPTGNKINMLVPDTCRMKDVLEKYVLRIGLGPEVIDNAVYFLYGGNKIKKNEKRTIREMFMLNGAVIIVIDKKGVIGA